MFSMAENRLKGKIVWAYYLFIYCLFSETVSCSDYVALNDRMINEWWGGKDVKGSGCGLILRC